MHLPSFLSITGVGLVSNIAWGVIMPSVCTEDKKQKQYIITKQW